MQYKFINQNSNHYQKAVNIRMELFFKDMERAEHLINDPFESKSLHLVCLDKDSVVGTGRLSIEDKKAIISQMAIQKEFQGEGIGSKILEKLIEKAIKLGMYNAKLSARKTAIHFYQKFGFEVYGDVYASKKTGVLHIDMLKKL